MFTITAGQDRITATSFEALRTALVDEAFQTGRHDMTEWSDWIDYVYPVDDEDYTPREPRELTQENLEAFARWIFDTPHARLIAGEPPTAQTLQALHDFMGWSLDDAAEHLDVAKRTYQRWLAGQAVAPVGVEGELRRACAHLVERAKLLAETDTVDYRLDDEPEERRAHALAEVLYRD